MELFWVSLIFYLYPLTQNVSASLFKVLRHSDFFRLRIVYAEGIHGNGLHDLRLDGFIVVVCHALGNRVDNVHAFSDLAESRIGTV